MIELSKTRSKARWTTVAFGDVVRHVKDRVDPEKSGLERYVAGEHMDTDDLRIRRWGEIGDGYLGPAFHMRFKPGHVLYGSRRTYLRKVAVADFEGITANTTYVLESADPRVLLPDLLAFVMQTEAFAQHSVRESKGSVNPYVNFSDLAWFKFALPPIEEQRRIVHLLLALDRSTECLQTLVAALDAAGTAYLDRSLRCEDKNAPPISVSSLLREPPRNGFSPKASLDQGRFSTVSISAVASGRFDPTGNTKPVNVSQDEAAPFLVEQGDIFAVRGNGNKLLTGKAGMACGEYRDLIYPDLLIRLRFNEARIHPRFALAQWNHPAVHGKLLTRAKSSNGIWKINGQDVRAHELVVPAMDRQQAIVSALDEFESGIAAAMARRVTTQQMKRAVMDQALGTSNE